jgi:hypothetical protein
MTNPTITDKETIKAQLKRRQLWQSFITGTGIIIDRHSDDKIDIFIRDKESDMYYWVPNCPPKTTIEDVEQTIARAKKKGGQHGHV